MTDSAKDSHPLIRLARVSKAYGAQKVIDGMDLDIWPSQKVALIGPSGSGKSTLLRLLMTIEKIDGGAIEIGGVSMWTQTEGGREVPAGEAHLKTIRSRIGMVFQAFNLFPHMTVEKNITLAPVTVLGLEPEEARRRAVELLGEVGLDHKKDAYPPSSPAVKSSAWPSPGRWPLGRKSSCSTKSPRRSTPSASARFSRCCAASPTGRTSPCCW